MHRFKVPKNHDIMHMRTGLVKDLHTQTQKRELTFIYELRYIINPTLNTLHFD